MASWWHLQQNPHSHLNGWIWKFDSCNAIHECLLSKLKQAKMVMLSEVRKTRSIFRVLSISVSRSKSIASCYFFNSSYAVFKLSFFSLERVSSRLSALISTEETLFALSKADSRFVHFSWNILTLSVNVFSVEITRLKSRQTRLTWDSNSLFVVSSY